ncbi:MAG: fructose-bisphosphate aldolase class II [Paracoccaceae bacterium]|jgi:fructose-bisphosphate aldolase class II
MDRVAAPRRRASPPFDFGNMAQRTAIIGAARACDAPVILHARRGAWSDAGGIVLHQIVEALAETCPKTPICLHQDLGAVPSAAA